MSFDNDAVHARRVVGALLVLAAVMVLVDVGHGWSRAEDRGIAATSSASPSPTPVPAAQVSIEPADDARKVRPDKPVVIRADGGRLTSVSVTSKKGRDLSGTFNADRTTWTSTWTMSPSARYVAKATAENSDHEATTETSAFRTLKPRETFSATVNAIAPGGSTVGVGFPLILDFSVPIKDKADVERALEVRMSRPVEGAWHWTSDTQIVFRPKEYWPAHQKIRLVAHLTGVRAAPGVFGDENVSKRWTVGEKVIVKASAKTKRAVVYENDEKIKSWPVSMGQGGVWKYHTTSGIHLTMGKSNPEQMISPGIEKGEPGYYDELVYWAVRISNSGEYIHSMPSTVWAQGRQNVSHGCINSPPQKAEWFYKYQHPGDVVIITGTPRKLEYNNGWGFWQKKSWKSWVAGSALNRSVTP